MSGPLIDELLLVTGLAPLQETNLREEPCEKLYATDASPDGAAGCVASVTKNDWLAQNDSAEEKGEHVRLDWKGEEPPSNMHDGRAAAAPISMKLNWTTTLSHSKGKHINLLELESLISLLSPVTREGVQARRLLVLVDSRMVLGAVSKRRSTSRKIYFLFGKTRSGALLTTLRWNYSGCPPGLNPSTPL